MHLGNNNEFLLPSVVKIFTKKSRQKKVLQNRKKPRRWHICPLGAKQTARNDFPVTACQSSSSINIKPQSSILKPTNSPSLRRNLAHFTHRTASFHWGKLAHFTPQTHAVCSTEWRESLKNCIQTASLINREIHPFSPKNGPKIPLLSGFFATFRHSLSAH